VLTSSNLIAVPSSLSVLVLVASLVSADSTEAGLVLGRDER
jgi:hypothetical protein